MKTLKQMVQMTITEPTREAPAPITEETKNEFLKLYFEWVAVRAYYPERTYIDSDLKQEAISILHDDLCALIPDEIERKRIYNDAKGMTTKATFNDQSKLDIFTFILITRTHSQVFECSTGSTGDLKIQEEASRLYDEMTDDERAEATFLVNLDCDVDLKKIPKEYNPFRVIAIKRCKRRCIQGVLMRTADLIQTRQHQEANKGRCLSSSVHTVTCPVDVMQPPYSFDGMRPATFLGAYVRLFLKDENRDENEAVWILCDGFWKEADENEADPDELTGTIFQEPSEIKGYKLEERVSFKRSEAQDVYHEKGENKGLLGYMEEILDLAKMAVPEDLKACWNRMSEREKIHIYNFARSLRDLKPGTIPMKHIHGGYPG